MIQRAAGEARKATTSATSPPSAMRAERGLGDEGLGDAGAGEHRRHQRRPHDAGQDRVAADAARAELRARRSAISASSPALEAQ